MVIFIFIKFFRGNLCLYLPPTQLPPDSQWTFALFWFHTNSSHPELQCWLKTSPDSGWHHQDTTALSTPCAHSSLVLSVFLPLVSICPHNPHLALSCPLHPHVWHHLCFSLLANSLFVFCSCSGHCGYSAFLCSLTILFFCICYNLGFYA